MKIEIYDDKPQEPEKVLRLKLDTWNKGIDLVAVDAFGNTISTLLVIKKSGFYRPSFVSERVGLPLNEDEKVSLDE